MKIGEWYVTRLSVEDLYFRPLQPQKKGGFVGELYVLNRVRPRAKIKRRQLRVDEYEAAHLSKPGWLPQHHWRWITASDLPFRAP